MHLEDSHHWLFGFLSTLFLSAVLTGGEPRSSVPVILNEYNAVGAAKWLGGTASSDSDTHFGRVKGNGGNWIELVVTQDHLDMRNWYIDWSEDVDTGRITFTNHALWSDLRAGTIITLIEQDTAHGGFNTDTTFNLITDWWINVATMSGTTPQTTYITTTNNYNQPGAFPVGNNNFQITIYNAAGLGVAFGPVGEGICNFEGVSSEEVGKLEADPSPSITPCSAFHDGTSSTFGAPNRWANGTEEQGFGGLRGKIMDIELVALIAPSAGDGPTPTLPTSLSSVVKGSTFYMEIWAQTTENGGLSSVYTDVNFNPCLAHAVSITNTAAFSVFGGHGTIDNVSGLLNDVGGDHFDAGCANHFGKTPNWVRVAYIQMVADADGTLQLTAANTGGGFDNAICGAIGVVDKNRVTYGSRDLACGTASGQLLLTVPSAPQNVQVGGQVTVELRVADLTAPINGVRALITWNPQNLSFVIATLSPPWNVQFLDPASPIDGNLAYSAGIAPGSTSAGGLVATLTFGTLATGTPVVSFLPDHPAPFPALCTTLTKAAGSEVIAPGKIGMNQGDILVVDTAMCSIDGVPYNDGDTNPANSCQECNTAYPLVWSPKPNGTPCDDGLYCTANDQCTAGVCGGPSRDCNDGKDCTTDTCNEALHQCDHTLDTDYCEIAGTCYADDAASPGNECEYCDAAANPAGWTPRPAGYACNDGNGCTTNDACNGNGTCLGGPPLNCDDGAACTTDTCNQATGCVHTLEPGFCLIGEACYTEGAVNPANACQACDDATPLAWSTNYNPLTQCCNPVDGALTAIDDGNSCTTDTCDADGSVTHTPIADCCSTEVDCNDDDACTTDACQDHQCRYTPIPGCCTTDEQCNDSDPCTIDGCFNAECVHAPMAADNDGLLHVPAEYATIQMAICAAQTGEQVLVADGVYTGQGNGNVDFGGKAITVRSESSNPASCIIDCAGSEWGFYFHSGETTTSVVKDLTIRNGSGTLVANNDATGAGPEASPAHMNEQQTGAITTDDTYYEGSSLNFYGSGGSVYCSSSSPTLTNCRINGSVNCRSSSPMLTDCTISGSYAYYGGGLDCRYDSSPRLNNCTISGNTAKWGGGGVCCTGNSNPTLTNCKIRGNTAEWGGGIYCDSSNPMLTNCTINGNTAQWGGGMHCGSSSPTLTNCILWGDSPQEIFVASGTPVVTYCNVQGDWPGTGNINADPGFAFAEDFHLIAGSPCIDAGTNVPAGGLPTPDMDGNPRPLDGDGDTQAVADMGVYEFNATLPSIAISPQRIEFHIPEGPTTQETKALLIRNAGGDTLHWTLDWDAAWLRAAPSQGDCTGEVDTVELTADAVALADGMYYVSLSIRDLQASNHPRTIEVALHVGGYIFVPGRYPTIQAAIDAAIPGDEVIIDDGTYSGEGNGNLDFGGKAITVRSASGNPAACIIDCAGSEWGFYFHKGETAASIVKDLTIRNGIGMLVADNDELGAGSETCLSHMSERHVNAITTGDTYYEGSSLNFYGSGGGVYCSSSSPTLTNCRIYRGSVECYDSSPILTNCTISDSSAYYGGGLDCRYNSSPTLTNCTISGNTAEWGGGGVCCSVDSNPTLTNCTISGNTAESGGGVYCDSSSPTLTNCILWGDTPQEIYVSSGTPVVTYCDVQGGWPGTGNVDIDPLFIDPDGPDNDPNTWQDNNYRLSSGSPCIDAGNNSAVPSSVLTDLDGHPRFLDDPTTPDCQYAPGTCGTAPIVDMGAYEYQPPFVLGDLNCDEVVDVNDITPFALALTDPAAYQLQYPGCSPSRADINLSGTADGADIQFFVDTLLGR